MGIVQSLGAQVTAQFLEIARRSHFLQREHIRGETADHGAQYLLGCLGFGVGRPVDALNPAVDRQVVLHVVRRHCQHLRAQHRGAKGNPQRCAFDHGGPRAAQAHPRRNEVVLFHHGYPGAAPPQLNGIRWVYH